MLPVRQGAGNRTLLMNLIERLRLIREGGLGLRLKLGLVLRHLPIRACAFARTHHAKKEKKIKASKSFRL